MPTPALRSLRLKSVLGCCLLTAALPWSAPSPARELATSMQAPASYAIRNVTVHPMDGRGVLRDQTVVIRGGRIQSLAPTRRGDHAKASVIDGTGRHLIPGLIDTHVHIKDRLDAPLFVVNGVTSVRNMWGFAEHLVLREQIRAQQVLGPRMITAGRLFEGTPPLWPQAYTQSTPEELRKAIADDQRAGYDFIKVYSRLQPETYRHILEIAAERGLRVEGHVPGNVPLSDALSSGLRSMEHLYGIPQLLHEPNEPFVFATAWQSIDASKIEAVARQIAASPVWTSPTLLVLERFERLSDLESGEQALGLRYMPPGVLADWRNWRQVIATRAKETLDPDKAAQAARHRRAMVKSLHAAGAKLLIGTDVGNPYLVPGFSLREEAQAYVEAGLTPLQVLELATRRAAEFLGLQDEIGSIAVGKAADLVLLDASPETSVASWGEIGGVFIGARWLPRDTLDAQLREIEALQRANPASNTHCTFGPC